MVGQGGVDPPIPEGNGFTARRSCRFATDPYMEAQENYDISTSHLTGVRSASELPYHHILIHSSSENFFISDTLCGRL